MTSRNRYQLYFPLIDFCFWSKLAISAWFTAMALGWHLMQLPWALLVLLNIISTGSLILLTILLLARPLRDEFAERLWKKAATTFAYFMLIIPFPIWFGVAFLEPRIIAALRQREHIVNPLIYDQHLPSGIVHDHNVAGVAYNEFIGMVTLDSWVATTLPYVFAALFIWHRWRES